ncbi:MAG: glycosyltransferase family 2 protein [Lachnospiraceae bacterium]|nr:glycosyltransferase family 2 protein [Lachnospiraceae bacterium]
MIWIIMPVYNTEQYLEEAVDSIINQSVSFEDNIKLLLLDDASSDGSLTICQKYEKQYPENIRVIHFEQNQGVSKVRNYGLSLCANEPEAIVGFVDSDDKLAPDVVEKVKDYFQVHSDIRIATIEIQYFGAKEGEHKLNWKFREREVVDITKDYMYPQYYIGGVFFRESALATLRFDEDMAFWEDAMAVNQVILQEGKYGLVKEAVYWYRKRQDESSLVDKAWRDRERYTSFLENGYLRLMKYCKKQKHRILPYIQFLVAYHLRLFMLKNNREAVNEMISPEELAVFRRKIQKVLRKIKPEVLVRMPTSLPVIEAMMSIRQGKKVRARRTYTENDCIFSFRGYELARMSERRVILYSVLEEPEEYKGMWNGRFDTPIYQMAEEDYIFAVNDGERVNSVRYPYHRTLYILGDIMRSYRYASFAIALPESWKKARFGIHTKGIDILLNEIDLEEMEL